MKVEMSKKLQRRVKKHGSVLKAGRMQGGVLDAILLVVGGYFVVAGILLGALSSVDIGAAGLFVAAIFAVPGFMMILICRIVRGRKVKKYLSYYQKQTGYSVEELQYADKELMGYSAVKIGDIMTRVGNTPGLMFIVTEHYFFAVSSVKGCYLRRLGDIVAAFYSCQVPQYHSYRQGLFVISIQDVQKKPKKNSMTKKWYGGYESGNMVWVKDCEKLCAEALEEMRKRAPHIIPLQNIVVNGTVYNLLSLDNWQADWARILGRY